MASLERELKRGTLELLLLHILADEPTYGYQLVRRLAERTGGRFAIKEGTLYPVLYRLEDAGLLVPEWDQPARGVPRKTYRLTDAGRLHVQQLTEAWRDFSAAVNAVIAGDESSPGEEAAKEET